MSPGTPEGGFRLPEVVIGFDFGLRRIGLAVGDTLTGTARPLTALERKHVDLSDTEWRALEVEVVKAGARQLVVGCPYNVDGTSGPMTGRAKAFAKALGERLKLPVHLVDERYSSLEAEAALRDRRSTHDRKRYDRGAIDSAAATVVLERWLAGER
ncbi:MAG: Holliday junction resolvase RuvX [Steroidobacteraceae bacterium]|jgi:putative Holliday junction resolvase